MKLIPLTLTKDYVSHWGVWEGIRELVQNAFDTPEWDVDFDWSSIIVKSNGGTLPVKSLLLGGTSKSEDSSKVGQYGEGYKLAFLTLLRENCRITIQNGDERWTPCFIYSNDFQSDMLHVKIDDFPKEWDKWDVVIKVDNIATSLVQECRDNILLPGDWEVASESSRGTAYIKPEGNDEGYASVFVNGIFVDRVAGNFKFNYSFKPEYLTLDRDRNTVAGYELKYETAKLMHNTGDIRLISELSVGKYDDVESLTDYTWSNNTFSSSEREEMANIALSLFHKEHGDNAYPVNMGSPASEKKLIRKLCQQAGKDPVEVRGDLFFLIKPGLIPLQGSNLVKDKPSKILEKFLEKNDRKLYSKAKRELKDIIEVLKLKEG